MVVSICTTEDIIPRLVVQFVYFYSKCGMSFRLHSKIQNYFTWCQIVLWMTHLFTNEKVAGFTVSSRLKNLFRYLLLAIFQYFWCQMNVCCSRRNRKFVIFNPFFCFIISRNQCCAPPPNTATSRFFVTSPPPYYYFFSASNGINIENFVANKNCSRILRC